MSRGLGDVYKRQEVFIVGASGLFSKDKDLAKAWDKMIESYNKAVKTEVELDEVRSRN